MKAYSLILFLFFSGILLYAQPANLNISGTVAFEGEPYLAVNPVNPDNIVIAWMADDASTNFRVSIKSKTSFDGGTTWANSFIQPHFGTTWGSADVSMQFRKNGTVYLSYIDFHQATDSGGVYVTHSTDGGITWSAPVQAYNAITDDPGKLPLDRPWLAIDNSGNSNDGMFYLTTKPAYWVSPPNRAYLKTSKDSGKTWSPYRYIDSTNYLIGNVIVQPMPVPAIAPDGALCIAYPSYLPSQSVYPKMVFAKSYNKGSSFNYYNLILNLSTLPVADSSCKAGYSLATNPRNPNQMAFACLDGRNGDPDIYATTSNDGGLTWSNAVRVNDDLVGNGVWQDMVWASYDESNNLVVIWRDRRNGTGTGYDQSSDTYCAVSDNNGTSFKANVRLSTISAAYTPVLLDKGNDFLSCQLINDTIYACWGDVRNGNLNIYFTKTSVSTGSGAGIRTVSQNEGASLSVFPNPANDRIHISINPDIIGKIRITILNAKGQKVLSKMIDNPSAETNINVSHLGQGVYYIQGTVDSETKFNQELIISR